MEFHFGSSFVRILAGDIPTGNWDYEGGILYKDRHKPLGGPTQVLIIQDKIKSVSVHGQDQYLDVVRAFLGGAILSAFLGPYGWLAAFLTGKSHQVFVTCELTDGQKFSALVSRKTCDQLLTLSKK